MPEAIVSRKNPLMTHIRKLQSDRAYRRAAGEYVGDGMKLLDEAVRWNAPLTAVVTAGETVCPAGEFRSVTVPPDVMESISPMRTPQGALFTAKMPCCQLPEALEGSRYLVLDGLQNPGNLGTIWRTADALGADGLFLLGSCADPWGHKAVRASMGACFRLPVWEVELDTLCALLRAAEVPLYAAALGGNAVDLRTCSLTRAAVVVGSEGSGVTESVLAACDGRVVIPMRERCESLNAAAAASILLWEMAR